MRKLRVPRALVVVVATGAIAAGVVASCGDDEQCIPCIPDPRLADAGVDGPPVECPACMPKDGVCPMGCVPEGFV